MPDNGYFSIRRDNEITRTGGFMCYGCLLGKQTDEQSSDPRYCQICYDVLLNEAELLDPRSHPKWVPRNAPDAKIGRGKLNNVSQDSVSNMSTLEKRGPKRRELPEDLIRQMQSKEMGSKAIATMLHTERGLKVSYKTIQRVLSGER